MNDFWQRKRVEKPLEYSLNSCLQFVKVFKWLNENDFAFYLAQTKKYNKNKVKKKIKRLNDENQLIYWLDNS